jgi:hypothetical protein
MVNQIFCTPLDGIAYGMSYELYGTTEIIEYGMRNK